MHAITKGVEHLRRDNTLSVGIIRWLFRFAEESEVGGFLRIARSLWPGAAAIPICL